MNPHSEGGCLCGVIRYRLSGDPLTLYACHCTDCQALSGGAFRLTMAVLRADLELTRGEPERFTYTLAGAAPRHATRCATCSVGLWAEPPRLPTVVLLRPGTLDERGWLRPVAHIWVRSAQPWFRIPEDALVFECQPPDDLALVRAWKARAATRKEDR